MVLEVLERSFAALWVENVNADALGESDGLGP